MMTSMPINDERKSTSAIFSDCFALCSLLERMDAKENRQEAASITATTPVISSINVFCDLSLMWTAVITNKQKPKRLAAVFKMCGDVLFGMKHKVIYSYVVIR